MDAVQERARKQVVSWAKENPRIRRVWLYSPGSPHQQESGCDVDIAIEMEPVPDSEETLAYWMAHAESWQMELQKKTGTTIELEWYDPDFDAPLECVELAYDRTAP
jgi:predicted nucleotidyltransferase